MPRPAATTSKPAPPARLGLVLPLEGVRLADHAAMVSRLTDWGYRSAWAGETNGLDAVATLAAAAAWNPDLHVGTGVVPAATRGPAVLAMSTAALAELAGGGVSLGIGPSSPVTLEQWNASIYDRPVARVRDTVRFLRRALAGERVDMELETFSVRGFRLARPPDRIPDVLVGALRPKMLAVAREEASGAVATCLAECDVPAVAGVLGPGRRLVAWLLACPSRDAERVRAWARPWVASYLCVPAYAEAQRWHGRGDLLDPVWRAWKQGDRAGAAAAVPDEVVDALVIHGPPEQCAERVRRFFEAGVTEPVIAVRTFDEDPVAATRSLGMAVQR